MLERKALCFQQSESSEEQFTLKNLNYPEMSTL